MGGDIELAVKEVRSEGLIVISLNMAGSVPDASDLVISDPGASRRHGRHGDRRNCEVHHRQAASPRFLRHIQSVA